MDAYKNRKNKIIYLITPGVIIGTFFVVFGIIWTLLEPIGGLDFINELFPNLKENKIFLYIILIIFSFLIAVITELLRKLISQNNRINELSQESICKMSLDKINNSINKNSILNYFLNFSETDSENHNIDINSNIFINIIIIFFEWLGLVKMNKNKYIANTNLGKCIIRSIAANIKIDNILFKGINKPIKDSENKLIRELLKYIETNRLAHGNDLEPIRIVESSLVVIKAIGPNEENLYLLQYSESWGNGYFWWIGGVQENQDKTSKACAIRELYEELGIGGKNIENLIQLGSVHEKIISERIGAYTEYIYNIYFLYLKNCKELSHLFKMENEIIVPFEHINLKRKNKWLTWEEITLI